jgi:small glutamine-rich tetratricopeptide repeat-containing protein alpha
LTIYSHAHYSLGAYESAANAFQKGLDVDPTSISLKSGKENALARIISEAEAAPSPGSPPRSAGAVPGAGGAGGGFEDVLRSLGGGAGAGGGLGGMDIAGMMQNPALMNMAQQMMANGGLENLMQNPAMGNMVCKPRERNLILNLSRFWQMDRLQSGGGMPSMAELMNDPTMRQM